MTIQNHSFIHDTIIYTNQELESSNYPNNYYYNDKGVVPFGTTYQSNTRIFLWLDPAFEKSFPDRFQFIISQNFKGSFGFRSTKPVIFLHQFQIIIIQIWFLTHSCLDITITLPQTIQVIIKMKEWTNWNILAGDFYHPYSYLDLIKALELGIPRD